MASLRPAQLRPRPLPSAAAKWLGLVTAVWVQAISGNNYTFSNYSDALKTLMALTQLQLNNLSVAKDIGKAFGILAGLASDWVPTPVVFLIGSVEGLIGYGVQWLVVSRRIQPLSYWQMCIFMCMGGNSTTWMNTAVLVTCIRNFRRNRGPVSGILKGFVGLSTAIFTDLSASLFPNPSPSTFLLMLSTVPLAVCLSAAVFLRELPLATSSGAIDDPEEEAKYLGVFNAVAVAVALYLLAFDVSGPHGRLFSKIFAGVLLVLLASPLSVPAYTFLKTLSFGGGKPGGDVERAEIAEPLLSSHQETVVMEMAAVEEGQEERRRPVIGEDHTIMEAVATVDFWVMFVSFLCGVGTELAVMNNMGQMGLALGYSDVSIFVSLMSIWGFFGRIGSGSVSEYFLKKAGTPRPLWNAASQLLMVAGYIVMALALPVSLYVGSVLVGICYGVRLAVTVATASELFGLKHYGLIYNILILNLPLGSFLFSGLLAGLLYDAEATEIAGGGNTCIGAHCYRLVFIVMAVACVLGFGLDLLLAVRTKGVYAKICSGKRSKKPGNSTEQ